MLAILDGFINQKKYFSIENLNFKILTHNYCTNNSNKPPLLNIDPLKKKKIKMSSNEMWTFVRIFGILVGDSILFDFKAWRLYIFLKEILDICCSPRLHKMIHDYLKYLIERHHKLYFEISKENLTPKFHNLLHYLSIIKQIEPIYHLSSLRFDHFTCSSKNQLVLQILKLI